MKKIKITLLILFSLFLTFIIYSLYPKVTYTLDRENGPGRIFITDRFGKIITDKQKPGGYFKSTYIDLKTEFVSSLIKIEDKNYYDHYGIDFVSKLRALKDNFSGKKISGGSTITEQYIKNKYFIGYKRRYLQKVREAFLALYISLFPGKQYSLKDDRLSNKGIILKRYLNNIYFGNNIYGIGGAIEVYFAKDDIKNLTQEEITILISLINNPGIKSLEEKHFRAYFDKVKSRLGYSFERTIFRLNKKENIDKFPFVTRRVLISAPARQKEIILESSIDSELQEFSKTILNETLDDLKGKNVTNGAFVAYNPKTMEVLAYQGSRNFNSNKTDGQVDVITSNRQLGSTLKPFLYLNALKNGANPDDFIIDMESEYNSFKEGKTYISQNYSLREYGIVRFKKALGNSLNNASVRLAKELGIDRVWQFFKDYGLDLKYNPEYYGYSLVLGNPSLSLENLVLSYRNLLPDHRIDNSRSLIFLTSPSPQRELIMKGVINPDKFLLYNILSNPDNRDISFGVNSILNTSIYQAVKTGTSSDFRDNSIISYNPDLIVGIWIGNNDNSSMSGVSGITGAGYLWHQIIEKAIKMGIIKDKYYKIPKGIEKGNYCLDKKCFRKELIYKKTGKEYKSSIIEGSYYKEDIYEKLNDFEKNKLDSMGFNILKY